MKIVPDLLRKGPTIIAAIIVLATVILYTMNEIGLMMSGIHLTIGSFGYLLIIVLEKKHQREKARSENRIGRDNIFWLLSSSYFILSSTSIIFAFRQQVRKARYFEVIFVLALIIILQITRVSSSKTKIYIVMLEIIAIHLNLVYSLSLKYYYYFGRVDLLIHVRHTASVVKTGKIDNIVGIYEGFPLWHILSSIQHGVLGSDWMVWKTIAIIGGITGLIAITGCYSISKRIFHDERVAIYSAFFVSLSPVALFYSSYAIPRSAIGSFMVILFLIILMGHSSRNIIILLLLSVAITIYHPSTPPFLLVILFLFVSIQYFKESKSRARLRYYFGITLFTLIIVISYWVFQSGLLIETIASRILASSPGGVTRDVDAQIPLIQTFNNLYYAPILTLIFLSIREIADRYTRLPNQVVIFSVIGFFFTFIAIPGPLALISKLLDNFSFTRWELYVYPFLLILASYGFKNIIHDDGRRIKIMGVILIVFLLTPVLFGTLVAPDNPGIETDRRTGYFMESEVTSFDHATDSSDQTIYTDYATNQHFVASSQRDRVNIMGFNPSNGSVQPRESGLIVYRQMHASERSLLVENEVGQLTRMNSSEIDRGLSKRDLVYNTKTVKIFQIYDGRSQERD